MSYGEDEHGEGRAERQERAAEEFRYRHFGGCINTMGLVGCLGARRETDC